MSIPAILPRAYVRGSRYAADGRYYPAEEERTVPLTERALRLTAYLYYALRYAFQNREDVHPGADQFLYWDSQDLTKKIAPDAFVIVGVPRDPPRDVIRIWEEAVPDLVVEVSSAGSRSEDPKREIYQSVLGCPEYLIFDEDLNELQFLRLVNGQYRPQSPTSKGQYHSVLGLSFALDPDSLLRVFDLDGQPIPESEEWVELYAEMQQQAQREWKRAELAERRFRAERKVATLAQAAAEEERARAEAERARADEAISQADALKQELESLRAQLKLPE